MIYATRRMSAHGIAGTIAWLVLLVLTLLGIAAVAGSLLLGDGGLYNWRLRLRGSPCLNRQPRATTLRPWHHAPAPG